jgi:8-oxo-dGTP pyrophosphatase MutT (NUDIX family)
MFNTRQELQDSLNQEVNLPKEYKIAVGSLIFTPKDEILLLERGPVARDSVGKLEGVGGELKASDQDLKQALLREVKEEIGDVEITIDQCLGYHLLPGQKYPYWVIVDFLCRLTSGSPRIMEPEKCNQIHLLSLDVIKHNPNRLSHFQQATMEKYFSKFGSQPYYI